MIKKLVFLSLTLSLLLTNACVVKPTSATYTLNSGASSLKWKGKMSEDYGHIGTVGFTDGSITTKDETIQEGLFTVDMTSIEATSDDNLEADKAEILAGHLKGTLVDESHPADLFFNAPAFPKVQVKVSAYSEGNLPITLDILGKELIANVPVAVNVEETNAKISGNFELDLTTLNVPGFAKDPETGEGISPIIEFELDLTLEKQS